VCVKGADDATRRVKVDANLQPRYVQGIARPTVPLNSRGPILVQQMFHQIFTLSRRVVVQEERLPDNLNIGIYGQICKSWTMVIHNKYP
jgi:hypothetical protein